jgi:hypothetical protein
MGAKGVVKEQNALEGPSCKAYHSFSGEEPQTLEHAEGALRENPCHLGKAKCRGAGGVNTVVVFQR